MMETKMTIAKYLALDCETGGTEHEIHSLLTVYLAACDDKWNILDTLSLKIKPDSGNYVVTAEAMGINKIDLIAHDSDPETISQSLGGQRLRSFLVKNTDGGKVKLVSMGKNVGFDNDFVTNQLLGRNQYYRYVSYREYDITSLIIFLKRTGKLPSDVPESLEGFAKWRNFDFVPHTADGDTNAGIEMVKYLESLV
jgi:hypothetical protein